MSVQDHYENLLADLYSWTFGDFVSRVEVEKQWLHARGLESKNASLALDLGAGAGCHALALAGLGFRVKAVDTSAKLVLEMQTRASEAGASVLATVADMVGFLDAESEPADAIVCMGDTLTHLESQDRVRHLLRGARARLAPGGRFVVTYRDLSNELTGTDRFFPVRADDAAIFTCFVEYLPERVAVHDIVHVREKDGWRMKKSVYDKLRLPRAEVERWLKDAGFVDVERADAPRGLTGLVARSTGPC